VPQQEPGARDVAVTRDTRDVLAVDSASEPLAAGRSAGGVGQSDGGDENALASLLPVAALRAPRGAGEARTLGPYRTSVAGPRSPAAPSIQVTIGRIEVRAGATPAAAPEPLPAAPSIPALTLDEYLAQRNGARR
jgi:hypothetical protein